MGRGRLERSGLSLDTPILFLPTAYGGLAHALKFSTQCSNDLDPKQPLRPDNRSLTDCESISFFGENGGGAEVVERARIGDGDEDDAGEQRQNNP